MLLQELQKDYELKEPFAEVAPGVWQVPVDENITVMLHSTPAGMGQGVILSCSFGEMPIGEEEELYRQMLLANLNGQGTKGGTLSLSDDGRRLILSRVIDYDINFKDFRDMLDDFISVVDFWQEEVATRGK